MRNYVLIWLAAIFIAGLARFISTRVGLAWYQSKSLHAAPVNVIVSWAVIGMAGLITAIRLFSYLTRRSS